MREREAESPVSVHALPANPGAENGGERGPASAPEDAGAMDTARPFSRYVLDPTLKPDGLAEHREKLAALNDCLKRACPGVPNTTPREYDFEIGARMKETLLSLSDLAQEKGLRGDDLSGIAREGLENPDGHVKEAALHLMSTQDPSPANRDAILAHVIADYDGTLIEHGMLELMRVDPGGSPATHSALAESMAHGAPFVAQAVADGIGPFINEATYAHYERQLAQLDRASQVHRSLDAALRDYRLRTTGG